MDATRFVWVRCAFALVSALAWIGLQAGSGSATPQETLTIAAEGVAIVEHERSGCLGWSSEIELPGELTLGDGETFHLIAEWPRTAAEAGKLGDCASQERLRRLALRGPVFDPRPRWGGQPEDEEEAIVALESLPAFPHLKALELPWVSSEFDLTTKTAQWLRSCEKLRELRLHVAGIEQGAIERLFAGDSPIETLVLEAGHAMGPNPLLEFTQAASLRRLELVDMGWVEVDSRPWSFFSSELFEVLAELPHLTELVLSERDGTPHRDGQQLVDLLEPLRNAGQLERVLIEGEVWEGTPQPPIEECAALTFRDSDLVDHMTVDEYAWLPELPAPRELSLVDFGSGSTWPVIIDHAPNVTKLALRRCAIDFETPYVLEKLTELRHLNLYYCDGVEGNLGRLVKFLPNLERLYVSGYSLRLADDELDAFSEHESIRELVLVASRRFRDDGNAIAEALAEMPALECVHVFELGGWTTRLASLRRDVLIVPLSIRELEIIAGESDHR